MRARALPAVPKLRFLFGAAVVAALFLLQLWEDRGSAARRVGISMETRDGAVVVTAVTPGLPADRAGLKGGDRILSIAGRPLAGRTTYDEIASEFAEESGHVRGQRNAGPQVLPRDAGDPFEWGPVAMVVLILAAYLALAGLAARQPEGDIRARLLQLFSLAVAFEFALPTGLIGSPTIALVSLTLQQLINGVQFGLELHLASVLPDRPEWIRRRPWLIRLYYAVGLAFGFGVAGTQLLEGLGVEALPWTAEQAQAVLYQAGFPVWALAVAMLLGHAMLTHAEPRRRQQAGLVFLGILPWVASVLIGLVFDLAGIARSVARQLAAAGPALPDRRFHRHLPLPALRHRAGGPPQPPLHGAHLDPAARFLRGARRRRSVSPTWSAVPATRSGSSRGQRCCSG